MRIALIISFVIGFLVSSNGSISAQTEGTPAAASLSIEKVAEGLNMPEGIAWNGKDDLLYISNSNSDWIARRSRTKLDTFVVNPTSPTEFKQISGIALNTDGSIYACDHEKGAILKFSAEGECEIVSPGFEDEKYNKPNDLIFDESGNLYFTDSKSVDGNKRDGRLFMIPEGSSKSKLVFDGLANPTGIAFSPDGSKIFISESSLNRIIQFQVKKDGILDGGYSEFIELPAGGTPEGIAVDVDGNIYVAHNGSGIVYEISPSREILREIKIKGKKPCNIEFGDTDLKSLFITEIETNSVYKFTVDTPGQKLFSSP